VTHKSGHYYDISHWECLNEVCARCSSPGPPRESGISFGCQVESEHAMSKEFYTQVYVLGHLQVGLTCVAWQLRRHGECHA
jgi:hypothetical protein